MLSRSADMEVKVIVYVVKLNDWESSKIIAVCSTLQTAISKTDRPEPNAWIEARTVDGRRYYTSEDSSYFISEYTVDA